MLAFNILFKSKFYITFKLVIFLGAVVVQLGERQTEDLDVAGSSPAHGIEQFILIFNFVFKLFFVIIIFHGNIFYLNYFS